MWIHLGNGGREWRFQGLADAVYAIIFTYRYFRNFGLGAEIREGLICDVSDVFVTINRHKLKWKFSRGLTSEWRKWNHSKNNHVYSNYWWIWRRGKGDMPLDKQVLTILYDLILYVNKELCPPPPPPPRGAASESFYFFSFYFLPASTEVGHVWG